MLRFAIMARIVAAGGAALTLAACSLLDIGEREQPMSCDRPDFAQTDFAQTVRCLHGALAAHPDAKEADLASLYLAWLDAAADRVEGGTLRETDARLDAAELYSRLLEARRQKPPAEPGSPKRYAGFLAGVAQWRTAEPLPASAEGSPRPVCTTSGEGDMRCI
jgi:hypothetical protein